MNAMPSALQFLLLTFAGWVNRKQQPTGAWMMQVGRNLTDAVDGFLLAKRYLIIDRDPLFTDALRELLQESGVRPLRLPRRVLFFDPLGFAVVLRRRYSL